MTTKNFLSKVCAISMVSLLQTGMSFAECNQARHPTTDFSELCAKPAGDCSANWSPGEGEPLPNRWGLQAAVGDGGTTSLGLVAYGERYSAGLTVSGYLQTVTGSRNTQNFKPGIFGGPRFRVRDKTYLGVGLVLNTQLGKQNGSNINSAIGVGPYMSVDYHATCHVVLKAWVNPYFFQQVKVSGQRTTTQKFLTGGLAVVWLF